MDSLLTANGQITSPWRKNHFIDGIFKLHKLTVKGCFCTFVQMVEELEINHFVLSEEEVASKLLIKVVLSSFFGGCKAGRSELYSSWALGFIFFNDVAEIIDPDAGHSVIFVKFKVVQLSKGHLSFCWGFVGEVEGLVAC